MEANPYSTLSFNSYDPKLYKDIFTEKISISTWEVSLSYSHVQYQHNKFLLLPEASVYYTDILPTILHWDVIK